MAWKILMYETPSGQAVVEQFILSMQKSTKGKFIRQLDLLEEFGPHLNMPHARPMGDGLYELRVRGKQEVHILYVFAKESNIYLLHSFQKKSQTTPKKELDLARNRKAEIE